MIFILQINIKARKRQFPTNIDRLSGFFIDYSLLDSKI